VSGVTYDAGALTAAEQGDSRLWRRHRRALESGIALTVPAGLLVQEIGRARNRARKLRGGAACN